MEYLKVMYNQKNISAISWVFVLTLLPLIGWAQLNMSADTARLSFLADSFQKVAQYQKAEAISWARANNRPVSKRLSDGQELEIMRIENGIPVYYSTSNIHAGLTTNTNDLWNGGALGLNLEGQNMSIGQWDAGAIRSTHQEFNPPGGGSSRISQIDSPNFSSGHSTHVAGSLIAQGINPLAKGMAPKAQIHAYDWNNHEAEMSSEAAAGLLISNHSYEMINGWFFSGVWYWMGETSISAVEDFNFGRYNAEARSWDLIVEAAPYFTIVKSTGNDRDDDHSGTHYVWENGDWASSTAVREPDGGIDGYDCIDPVGTAKNIITIGAISEISNGWSQPSDVIMSNFSSWGPTDDGRIKPDLVGVGVNVFSCDKDYDSDYSISSGTSMANPNIAGSLLLLQEHYHNTFGNYMRSSTLKALAIHTANEAGTSPGPDYENGWGVLDASRAASLISTPVSSTILEPLLVQGDTWAFTFISNGIQDFAATLAWIDPAAQTAPNTLNPAELRLVNDLDIRITDGTTTYQPWVLDPANPGAAATHGDNFRDNVENLEQDILPPGTYTLLVTHKGTLVNGQQPFSIIISGIPAIPIADFIASKTVICLNENVTLTNLTSGGALTYSWSILPNVGWSYINGTDSSSVNPQITFSVADQYSVTLEATNLLGTDIETHTNSIQVGGIHPPFFEDFESVNTQELWTIENPDGGITWDFETVGGNSGLTAASVNNHDYGAADNAVVPDHLISPTINLEGYTSATLEFEYSYRRYSPFYRDSLSIWISTDCGSSWIRLASYDENGSGSYATGPDLTSDWTPAVDGDWCNDAGSPTCPSIDLTAYVGMIDIRIRFTNLSGWGNDLYIDNVNVTGLGNSTLSYSSNQSNVTCFGSFTGIANVSASGGTAPYTFVWSDGTTTGDSVAHNSVLSGLAAGIYSCTVQDAVGASTIAYFLITRPIALSNSIAVQNPSAYGASDGEISVNAFGGTFPYQFEWSTGTTSNVNPNTYGSLSGGVYTLSITDLNGCTISQTVVLNEPPPPLVLSTLGIDNICANAQNGSIQSNTTGGVPPYQYSWSNGSSLQNLSGLVAGYYSLTVTDSLGSTASIGTLLEDPIALSGAITVYNESIVGASDGAVVVAASGGVAPYEYLWSNGNTTPIINQLSPGVYFVTLNDANSCSLIKSGTIVAGAGLLAVSANALDPPCFGVDQGAIDITVSGGTLPYTYNWSDGALVEDRVGLFAGIYDLIITDAYKQSISVQVKLTNPPLLNGLVFTTHETQVGSSNGTALVSPSGGSPPYEYLWSTGETSSSIDHLTPGNYSVTLTDIKACSVVLSGTVDAGVSVLTASGTWIDALCFGDASGEITLEGAGGLPPYSYYWSDGDSSKKRDQLLAGTYGVSVCDMIGQTVYLSFTISQPAALEGYYDFSDSCRSELSAQVTGGAEPYTYQWLDIGSQTVQYGTTALLSNACEDIVCYSAVLSITDANGCVLELDTASFEGCSSGLSDQQAQFNLYPNPGMDHFTIVSPSKIQRVVCINSFGVVVADVSVNKESKVVVDTYKWANGAYFIQVLTEKGKTTQSWIKTN